MRNHALVRLSISAAAAYAAGAAHAAIPVEACNSDGFESVVHAAPARYEARAVWLDRRLLKGPGAGGG